MNRQQFSGAVGVRVIRADDDVVVAQFVHDVRDVVGRFAGDVDSILAQEVAF